jgi:MurNAc alpha-1-phosphate uridylyltransferase
LLAGVIEVIVIAMILAAGRGERLRPLTDSVPKSLVEVQGEVLLERHLRALASAGFETVVINLGWLGEQIVECVGSGSSYGLNVVYSPEGDDILETGGGIQRALPMLGAEPFLVMNADIFTDMRLSIAAPGEDDFAHLVLVPTPVDKRVGDFDLVDGRVRNGDDPDFTFSGVAVYRPEFFTGCEPGRFSVVPMLRFAADAGQLRGSLYGGFWRDVGTPESLTGLNE